MMYQQTGLGQMGQLRILGALTLGQHVYISDKQMGSENPSLGEHTQEDILHNCCPEQTKTNFDKAAQNKIP